MNIISLEFIIFAVIFALVFFIVPKKWQWAVVLLGNITFYAFAGIGYIIYMIIISLITFLAAIKIEDIVNASKEKLSNAESIDDKKAIKAIVNHKKRTICTWALIVAMGIWVVLKYTNFFLDNVNLLIEHLKPGAMIGNVSWALPLGISFYTFHAAGYLVDVYRSKYPAERNYFKYLTFISYFPHIIQGPFSRFDELGVSIKEEHKFSYDRMCEGVSRMLIGFFKKIVIADKIGVAVNAIFGNYETYSGVYMMFAMFAYGIQLYADFAGYMDIVCGFSKILGINLAENFKRPYFAKTVDEFWRRWHITLGTWFKDYVFYPVSMGKTGQKMGKWARKKWGAKMGKLLPGYFALIFVWTATGLWHGANWTYLVWGYLNLIVITMTMQLTDFYEKLKAKLHIKSEALYWQIFCIVRTFILVCFFRFFSAAPDITTAVKMLKYTGINIQWNVLTSPTKLFVGVEYIDIFFIVIGTLIITLIDILDEVGVWEKIKLKCPMIIRNLGFTIIIMLIIMSLGSKSDLMGGFMYASF